MNRLERSASSQSQLFDCETGKQSRRCFPISNFDFARASLNKGSSNPGGSIDLLRTLATLGRLGWGFEASSATSNTRS